MREVTRLHGLLLSWRTVVAALALMIVAFLLLWTSEKLADWNPLWFGKVLPAFAAVVGTSGVFAIVYELLVRRQQTRYVLESLDLREALIRSGLDDVSTNYMDYDYASRIKKAHEIVLFVLYAQTWIARYTVEITKHLESPGKSLVLCVPAFGNPFLPALAKQFRYSEEDLRKRIADSIANVVQPALSGRLGKGSSVRVIWHQSRPAYSMYKFDDCLLVGTYYASSARRRSPMFEFIDVPGSMFEEFNADLNQVMADEGTTIFDSANSINRLEEVLTDKVPASLAKILDKDRKEKTKTAQG
ncbi:MAG: hypothetical protein BIFFINMI_01158 [Phycisphaerae bacterium]|nr:hypothetical protein [Phycisphaerae bacterium]